MHVIRHKRATGCTFLTPVVIRLLPMLPFMRTFPSSLLPRFLRLMPLYLLCQASLPWWSLLIPVLQFPLLHSLSPHLLLMFPQFSSSHLLQIPISYPPTPPPPRHPSSSFPKPLQMIFTFPSPFAGVRTLVLTIPFLTLFHMIFFLHSFVPLPFW